MQYLGPKRLEEEQTRINGVLTKKGVIISEKRHVDELVSRGFGVAAKKGLLLAFYEALYLMEKGLLVTSNGKGVQVSFQVVLESYEMLNENAWAEYLAYRDLRSRGYVVREGFGLGIDFRLYERGEFSKDSAKYLILSLQEGKPVPVKELGEALDRCKSLKKEMVLAVMNRRGEVVYYSVAELTLPTENE